MFKNQKILLISILTAVITLAMVLPVWADTGKVTGSIVNVRSGPGTDYAVAGTLYSDSEVDILESSGEWSKIQYKQLTGWVFNDLLDIERTEIYLEVIKDLVNLRSGPDTSYSLVGQVKRGDLLDLVNVQGEWYRVKTQQGTLCYVHSSLVADKNKPVETFNPVTPPPPPARVSTSPRVFLDQKQLTFDVEPIIENGRTLAPLRAIFEAMGAVVEWDNLTRTVTARKGNTTVILAIGSTTPTINGKVYKLDVPARIVNDRTLAPLRFVAEAFGGQVDWDGTTRTINITTSDNSNEPGETKVNQVIVKEEAVNLRGGPSTAYDRIDLARSGEKLNVVAEKDGWYQVSRGGSLAWVAGWVVDIDQEEPVVIPPVEEPPQEEEPQPPAVSFDRAIQIFCDINKKGIEIVFDGGTALNPSITEDKEIITYEFQNKQIIGSDYIKKSVGGGNLIIRGENKGSNAVIEVELPLELDYITTSQNEGKKEVLFIPNCITGVGRKVVGETGEIVLIKTLIPCEYSYSLKDDILEVELESISMGSAREEYDYVISRLLKKMTVSQDDEAEEPVTTLAIESKSPYKHALATDGNDLLNIILTLKPKTKPGDRIVVIDPGHGGAESGAIRENLKEKDINLDVALMVGNILEKEKDIRVEYTRIADTTVGLEERARIANNLDAAIFVSIHANAVISTTPSGTETFFYAPLDIPHLCEQRALREELAEALQEELLKNLRRIDRGVKEKNLSVLRNTRMPSALVEIAFMSNPAELQLLKQHSFKELAAQAIADGIIEYLENQ
jgi:N-acetylmuramoyl-L-alanine amidase